MTVLQKHTSETARQKRLDGKVVLVTGGSRGIGAAIALRLAEEGATVAITYNTNKALAEKVVGEITAAGSKGQSFKASVASVEDTQALIDTVVKQYGRIDVLVNNAGVFDRAPLEKMTLEHYNKIFDVNVKGVIATTAAAVNKIPDGGRIITISSVAAKMTQTGMSVYSASKAAIDTLTRVWAQELGPRKITVNNIAPGATLSDMYNEAISKEDEQYLITKTALGRIGQPDDIAAAVAFLASDDGRWVTGQSITVDGGLVG